MKPITRNRIAAYKTMAIVAHLEKRGCLVREAHAHLSPPVIRIDQPPPGVFDTYGFRPPPPGSVRVPVLCVAQAFNARVEWISKEKNQ